MNLIEQLGLERCQQIVDGAPEITTHINVYGDYIYVESKHQVSVFSIDLGWTHYHQREGIFSLGLIRAAIANHTDNLSHLTDHCSDIRNHLSPLTGVTER